MGLKHLIEWATKERIRKLMIESEHRICSKCGKPMRLEYYERPSGRPGNRYVPNCDCIHLAEDQKDE